MARLRILAHAIGRDGAEKNFSNRVLHITGDISKDRRTREIALPELASLPHLLPVRLAFE